ncbi:MAG: DsrE/DsrF/DrsH-like family protein [Halodesulfurarchaeum sp.]
MCSAEAADESLQERIPDLGSPGVDGCLTEMVIIGTEGTLDMAHPVLILGPIATGFGYSATVFATFWGLDTHHESHDRNRKRCSVGNPNMPLPDVVAMLPGMDRLTARLLRAMNDQVGTDTAPELLERGRGNDLNFQACQMAMDLMDYDEALIEGVETGVDAVHALRKMANADVRLLV